MQPKITVTDKKVKSVDRERTSANGEEGVHVYQMENKSSLKSCKDFEVSYLGYIEFGEGLSANHIASSSQGETATLFVAYGLAGIKILTVEFAAAEDDDVDDFDDDDDD